mmetsp:Transcript_6043/g.13218  ORF Transcript_6043/g.13218 Transcript_6043/m.13218 type:complete len:224 (+) Transcript_6043:668-1339(+)
MGAQQHLRLFRISHHCGIDRGAGELLQAVRVLLAVDAHLRLHVHLHAALPDRDRFAAADTLRRPQLPEADRLDHVVARSHDGARRHLLLARRLLALLPGEHSARVAVARGQHRDACGAFNRTRLRPLHAGGTPQDCRHAAAHFPQDPRGQVGPRLHLHPLHLLLPPVRREDRLGPPCLDQAAHLHHHRAGQGPRRHEQQRFVKHALVRLGQDPRAEIQICARG